jgi:hypothetical protein
MTDVIHSPQMTDIGNRLNNVANQVNTLTTNLSNTQYFNYPLADGGATKFYKIGTLTLPQGGHQAIVQVNLCYGFNTSPGTNVAEWNMQNYQLNINLYSSNGGFTSQGYVGSSRAVDPGSGGTDPANYLNGIFHHGFVNCISPWTRPLDCYLGYVASDPLNKVDVWIRSYAWHGVPLIQATQTAGSWSRSFNKLDNIPLTGYIQLDMFQTALPILKKNRNNFNLNFYP